MEKYKIEFKLKVIKSFLAGEGGAKLLERQWAVPEENTLLVKKVGVRPSST